MGLAQVALVVLIVGLLVGALTVARRWADGATSSMQTRARDQKHGRGTTDSHPVRTSSPHTVEPPVDQSSASASSTDATPPDSPHLLHGTDSDQTGEGGT